LCQVLLTLLERDSDRINRRQRVIVTNRRIPAKQGLHGVGPIDCKGNGTAHPNIIKRRLIGAHCHLGMSRCGLIDHTHVVLLEQRPDIDITR
jgi:hypothetical protein